MQESAQKGFDMNDMKEPPQNPDTKDPCGYKDQYRPDLPNQTYDQEMPKASYELVPGPVACGSPPPPNQQVSPANVVVHQPRPTTTVIIQQQGAALKDWEHGVCGCCSNMSNCLCGTFCGLCLLCRTWGKVDANSVVCCLLCCLCPACVMGFMRTETRKKYRIRGDSCSDCVCGCCCAPCVNCQMANEADEHV